MGKRATPPRSFNTIRQSQCEQRAKRKQKSRVVFLALCATLILLVIALTVFLICSIADAIGSSAPGGNGNSKDIVYQQYTKTESGIAYGELILINKDHKYSFPSTATSALVNMRDEREELENEEHYSFSKSSQYLLNKNALDAFHEMVSKYYTWSEGEDDIVVTTTYRTYEEQERLSNQSSSSPRPGHSDHHSGYCIALKALSDSHWIYENCHKYGFVVRYPDDKSEETGVEDYKECLRYVGVAHATYMKENDLCLEEYVELLSKDHQYGESHLSVEGADGDRYEIYYVPLSDDEITTVDVPSNYAYTISGDNDGGFIVTVNLDDPIE